MCSVGKISSWDRVDEEQAAESVTVNQMMSDILFTVMNQQRVDWSQEKHFLSAVKPTDHWVKKKLPQCSQTHSSLIVLFCKALLV